MTDSCYCIALRAASRKVTATYDEALAPIGVNIAQFSLLRTIARTSPLSLTELGRIAKLDRSTIGRNVRLLERMGLVRVTPGADQREATLTLDTRGYEVLSQGVPLWDQAQERLADTLGSDSAKTLLAQLQSL